MRHDIQPERSKGEMPVRRARFTKEEHARRGQAIEGERIRPLVETDDRSDIVAIDSEAGDFEFAGTTLDATNRLLTECADAQCWCVRVVFPGVHRFGRRGGRA